MKMNRLFGLIFALLVSLSFAQEDSEFVQEDAHEHGAALLSVVLDGETLSVDLESPAVNLVGFEYEPGTDEEMQAVEDALAQLEDPMTLLAPAEGAGCELASADTEHLMTDEGGHAEEHGEEGEHGEDEEHSEDEEGEEHSEDEEHADEEGAQHSEFRASYSFTCSSPDALSSLNLSELFTLYPGIEDLDVQYVLPSGQGAAELGADSAELTF